MNYKMFWKKKNLQSEEFLQLKKEISLLWIEIDALAVRKKRKIKNPVVEEGSSPSSVPFDDGFNELRKINKDNSPDYY